MLGFQASRKAAVAALTGSASAAASASASPAKRLALAAATVRSFYTFNVPTDTPRIQLDDGSKLVFLQRLEPAQLPPRVRTFPERAMLSSEQINRMRELRESDPDSWTVLRLAREFNTFPGFVMMVTRCPKERVDFLLEKAQQDFDAISISKKLRAINRLRRKELW
eukprot:jgi/Hompol1/1849/HPOL_005024-RA